MTHEFKEIFRDVEPDLIPLLTAIQDAPQMPAGRHYNPLSLMRTVNVLRAAGKERALEALLIYSEAAQADREPDRLVHLSEARVFLIARLFFEPIDRNARFPRIGGSFSVEGWTDAASWPLFPLAVVDDWPFVVVVGYDYFGTPQSATEHIVYCRQKCRIRAGPVNPPGSPMAAADRLVGSDRWKHLLEGETPEDTYRHRELVRHQALRAISSMPSNEEVFPYSGIPDWHKLSENQRIRSLEERWRERRADLGSLKTNWDPAERAFNVLGR